MSKESKVVVVMLVCILGLMVFELAKDKKEERLSLGYQPGAYMGRVIYISENLWMTDKIVVCVEDGYICVIPRDMWEVGFEKASQQYILKEHFRLFRQKENR